MKQIVVSLPDAIDPTTRRVEESIEAFVTEIDPDETGTYWEIVEEDAKPILPLPGDTVGTARVIASVWGRDDEDPIFATILMLNPQAPYYGLYEITWDRAGSAWSWRQMDTYPNIVPAVEAYQQAGGDY